MIFEHVETGLQVRVTRHENVRMVRSQDGEIARIVERVDLLTDVGQVVLSDPPGDENPHAVNVMTARGRVSLIRVSS